MPEGIPADHPILVRWNGDRRYSGGPPDGPMLTLDGDRATAPSPVDAVLIALGSCAAVDVVDILAKRRTPATRLDIRIDFRRAAEHPRRLTAVDLIFSITTESARNHVERAIKISFDRYCSVASSLTPDLELSWTLELNEPAGPTSTAKS